MPAIQLGDSARADIARTLRGQGYGGLAQAVTESSIEVVNKAGGLDVSDEGEVSFGDQVARVTIPRALSSYTADFKTLLPDAMEIAGGWQVGGVEVVYE